jgi:hypothetical protein
MTSVEVLAGPERRRRWSIEQKQSVAAAFEPGAMVREVLKGLKGPVITRLCGLATFAKP